MVAIRNIRQVGNKLLIVFEDTSTQFAIPAQGLYLPVGTAGGGTTGGGGTPGTVAAPVDDYPYPTADPNALSPFRYSYRDCTDFCCWRINRDNGDTSAPWTWTWAELRPSGGNGDAIGWRGDWLILGYDVDIAPVPGCIGWIGSRAGEFGHVAYVQAVSGDSLVIEDYNWGGTQAYGTRTMNVSDFDSFLAMPH